MTGVFQNDVQDLINQLNIALNAAQKLLEKKEVFEKNFKTIMPSSNLHSLSSEKKEYQNEIKEYIYVIECLKYIQNNDKIPIVDFDYLNTISYMQDFMKTHGQNIPVIARRYSI